jgi:hypothetical protein
MVTFKERCEGKVWRAMDAMIQGLDHKYHTPDNAVDFRTFGMYCDKSGKAYFNGATAGIQYILHYSFGVDIENRDVKVMLSETSINDYERFEKALDDFSAGKIGSLLHYFDLSESRFYSLPAMNNRNWKDILYQYERTAKHYKNINK